MLSPFSNYRKSEVLALKGYTSLVSCSHGIRWQLVETQTFKSTRKVHFSLQQTGSLVNIIVTGIPTREKKNMWNVRLKCILLDVCTFHDLIVLFLASAVLLSTMPTEYMYVQTTERVLRLYNPKDAIPDNIVKF